jgi:hypothetical protein
MATLKLYSTFNLIISVSCFNNNGQRLENDLQIMFLQTLQSHDNIKNSVGAFSLSHHCQVLESTPTTKDKFLNFLEG